MGSAEECGGSTRLRVGFHAINGAQMSAKVNKSVTLHKGRVFTLLRENITLDNGVTVDLDVIRHPGASAVVAVSDDNKLILIKQFRHAVGDYIWEIPAGTLDPDETYLECAKRELVEETGFSANNWRKLGEIIPVPGYSDERIRIFLATGLVSAQQDLDKDEVLAVHEIRMADAIDMIRKGAILDGKTITGLFMANQWISERT
jgi:8-oxo-dGTP pyrophosphatase MutT (NUDIX family)